MKLNLRVKKLEENMPEPPQAKPDLSMLTTDELRFLVENLNGDPKPKEIDERLKEILDKIQWIGDKIMGLKDTVKRLERQVSVNETEHYVTIIDDIPGRDGELPNSITLLHITSRGTAREEISQDIMEGPATQIARRRLY